MKQTGVLCNNGVVRAAQGTGSLRGGSRRGKTHAGIKLQECKKFLVVVSRAIVCKTLRFHTVWRSVGLTAYRGDSWRDTIKEKTRHIRLVFGGEEAPMALVTLKTIFSGRVSGLRNRPICFPPTSTEAARTIIQCRTAALEGHIQACPDGHIARVWYNSCRHRSCPQCAYLQTERWPSSRPGSWPVTIIM